jgi:hypothetical protein
MPACGACGLRGRRARGGALHKKAPHAWRCRDEEACGERAQAGKLQKLLTAEPKLDRPTVVWGSEVELKMPDGTFVSFWQRLAL